VRRAPSHNFISNYVYQCLYRFHLILYVLPESHSLVFTEDNHLPCPLRCVCSHHLLMSSHYLECHICVFQTHSCAWWYLYCWADLESFLALLWTALPLVVMWSSPLAFHPRTKYNFTLLKGIEYNSSTKVNAKILMRSWPQEVQKIVSQKRWTLRWRMTKKYLSTM